MGDRQKPADLSDDILINGVSEIADSLAGGSSETPSVADMMANPQSVLAAAARTMVDETVGRATANAVPTADQPSESESNNLADPSEAAPEESDDDQKKKKKKKKKQPGLGPRWSYILTRGIVVASVWGFFTFAFDPILRHSAITAGQQAVQAKVEIASLQTSFFPPKISITNVAAANRNKPGTNIFEFESMNGDIDGQALMHGSYVLDKAVVNGLTWNTPRDDDGLLPDSPPPDESEGPGFGDQLEKYGKEWANDIFERAKQEYDPRNLESVRLAQQLEVEWKTDFDGLEARIQNVDAAGRQLKQLVDQTKKMNPVQRVEAYRKIANDGSRLLREVSVIREDLKVLPKKAEGDLGDLDEARKRDQAEIKRKVEELVVDGDKLSEFLLGPTVHQRIRKTLAWLDWGSEQASKFSDTPKPERQRGDDVFFPLANPLPDYLARLIQVTGQGEIGGDQMTLQGTIVDVSSDPVLYGKPTIVHMKGQGEADVQMKAELDRTQDIPANILDVAYVLDKATTSHLGDDDSLAVEVRAGSTRWNVHIETVGDQLTGTVAMLQAPVLLVPQVKADDETLGRLIAASMKDIDRIDATVELSGTVRKPKLKLKTNLGETISNGVKQGFSREISAQKDALIAKLDTQINEKHNGLVGMFRGKYGDIFEQLNLRESSIQDLIPKVAGQPLDASGLLNRVLR
ncbi:MAG: TIGR03545 family protein [Planctomycetota bacterium]|nr:TIGR03545 family protein [Planctomycetota bacterium]MDA1158029.1 TIGR03545 family protein [Planctomycetota bacterium]